MSTNKDLLKQAIAEAKTIREAAIANAKEALEETLTPHLKEMLALKLQEMEEEDNMEENVNEEDVTNIPEEKSTYGNIEEAEEEEDETEEETGETEEEEAEQGEETEEEELEIEDMSVEDLKDLIRDIVSQEMQQKEMPEEMPEESPEMEPEAGDMVGMEDEEEIDINEILAELEEAEIEEYGDEHPISTKDALEKDDKLKEVKEEDDNVKEELEEALTTVAQLRTQLQEVNLLNAKLLYVNKVFKANNLTESQKVNVVAAFDKAETVKEVKLVYETVSKNVSTKQPVKQAIKEHKSFASKPAGVSNKQVIVEESEAVKRMQILAGIRQREY